jgi:hypothetical protein
LGACNINTCIFIELKLFVLVFTWFSHHKIA